MLSSRKKLQQLIIEALSSLGQKLTFCGKKSSTMCVLYKCAQSYFPLLSLLILLSISIHQNEVVSFPASPSNLMQKRYFGSYIPQLQFSIDETVLIGLFLYPVSFGYMLLLYCFLASAALRRITLNNSLRHKQQKYKVFFCRCVLF